MPDPLSWIAAEAEAWRRGGLGRRLHARGPAGPGRIDRDGEALVNFGSNDYLGLAADPRVVEAARRAAEEYGWGAGASPLVTGWSRPHADLAEALAGFERAEAVALFASGYAANLGTIAALVGPTDAVYADRLDHACLIDGVRVSGARLRVYPHNDAARLGSILDRDRGRFRRSLIATDGVFSMDGDLAPLGELADLAGRHGAILLVDEAHGTGVFGSDGRGAASEAGVVDRVHVRVGTLSKALGSIGGFVAGSRDLIDWLVNRARPLVYSTAMPPAAAAAARKALEIVESEPWRRSRVRELGGRLRGALDSAGFEPGPTSTPIVPVRLGTPERCRLASEGLRARGMLVPSIRPPTVPAGTSRLRISLSAAHSDDQVAALIRALVAIAGPNRGLPPIGPDRPGDPGGDVG